MVIHSLLLDAFSAESLMFRINKHQMDSLAEMVLVSFIESACEFLRSTVPERWTDTGDAGLHAWVDARVRHALSMGLHDEDSVLRYLEVASVYGEDFAERGDVLNMLADPDFLEDWDYARRIFDAQVLCVRQTHLKKKDGTQSTEWRYFVTSLSTVELSFAHLLRLVRLHWAIENRHHWTLDMVLEEDDRQPCLHSRSSLEVTAWLRVLAYNLLSAWRARLPLKDRLPVAWARACELLRDALVHARAEVPLPTLA